MALKKEKEYAQNAEILKALAHSTRLRITEVLINAEGSESSVMDIVKALNLPQATISQHLKILKSIGIIEGERHGTRIIYKIRNEKVKVIIKALTK